MPKPITANMQAHLGQDLTALATCWKVTRLDGQVFRFTDHDQDIEVFGEVYEARSGILPSAFQQNRAIAVDNMEIQTFLSSEKISEDEIRARCFDHALLDIFIVNWDDPTMVPLWLLRGFRLGELEIRDLSASAEARGKAQNLQQSITEIYSATCLADLGDERCQVDTEGSSGFNYSGTVEYVVDDRKRFIDTGSLGVPFSGGSEPISGGELDPSVFRFGKLDWLEPESGDIPASGLLPEPFKNAGKSMEVKTWDHTTGEFELFESMHYPIVVGDRFFVRFGCDKRFVTCKERFDNVLNFRGFPFVPGPDALLDVGIPPRR